MYHPAPPPAGNTNDSDNFEYIELKNRGGSPLNLIGFRFTNGIDFTFTATSGVTNLGPGQRVVVVQNRAAFSSRYPTATSIAGEYLGNLDNSGERLALLGSLLEPIHDFRYENSWYPITDGLGFSLVIADENAALADLDQPGELAPQRRRQRFAHAIRRAARRPPGGPDHRSAHAYRSAVAGCH